ncbi:TPA: hypothetical protein U2Q81_000351 [Enterobacter hormaechei]|nr:hypothetical protein [Enterobacter hormaechei]
MLDWITTAIVLLIGVAVLVTGLIEYLLIGFMVYLALCVIAEIILAYKSASCKKASK